MSLPTREQAKLAGYENYPEYIQKWLATNRDKLPSEPKPAEVERIINEYRVLEFMRPVGDKPAEKRDLIARFFRGEFDRNTPRHWLLRISDGEHFKNSYPFRLWGVNSTVGAGGKLTREAIPGDVVWFVRAASHGLIVAAAEFTRAVERGQSQLTNEQLGWTKQAGVWDYEIHYDKFINLTACGICTSLKTQSSVTRFNPEKIAPNLPELYVWIKRLRGMREEIW